LLQQDTSIWNFLQQDTLIYMILGATRHLRNFMQQ
jgi:hypothetical protein